MNVYRITLLIEDFRRVIGDLNELIATLEQEQKKLDAEVAQRLAWSASKARHTYVPQDQRPFDIVYSEDC